MKADETPQAACARCGEAFHCGVDDDKPCWCSQVKLNPQTLRDLEQRYRGCLCGTCLMAMQAQADSNS
jgi:ribosomal protein L34E